MKHPAQPTLFSIRPEREVASLRERYAAQARRMVGATLLHMHEHFFEQEENRDKHKHRVTLFECRTGDGPGGCTRWLAIYAREGAYPDSDSVWPLDACRVVQLC